MAVLCSLSSWVEVVASQTMLLKTLLGFTGSTKLGLKINTHVFVCEYLKAGIWDSLIKTSNEILLNLYLWLDCE